MISKDSESAGEVLSLRENLTLNHKSCGRLLSTVLCLFVHSFVTFKENGLKFNWPVIIRIMLTFFFSRLSQSMFSKKRWPLISWASVGPPPNLLAGSLTRSPRRRSRASLEMLTLRGNLTSSTNILPVKKKIRYG